MSVLSKYVIIDDVNNQSDHLPVLFEFNIEISKHDCESDKEFVPKPLWGKASPDDLNKYKRTVYEFKGRTYFLFGWYVYLC